MQAKQCPNCGRWQAHEELCRFCRWLAGLDPQKLIGRRARRNAAWGPTRATYEIVDARRNRRRPIEIMVRLNGYKGWFYLRDLYLVDRDLYLMGQGQE